MPKTCRATIYVLVLVFVGSVGICRADPMPGTARPGVNRQPSKSPAIYQHAVVAADHPAASAAGTEILRRGGNVVDAAVATSFALSVVRPASCGIGGGGFMMIWNAEKREAVAIDYRERAPQAATRDLFTKPPDGQNQSSEPSRKGALAVAVPGTVAGLCFAQREYGTLDLPSVLAPALRLARDGVVIEDHDLEAQKVTLADLAGQKGDMQRYEPLVRLYLNGGRPWKQGERFHSPQGRVLEIIASRGADGFYRGAVANAVVDELRRRGGIITLDDLAATKPVVRRALRGTIGRFEIVTMPPPSSGGVALLETLNILSAYERAQPARRLEQLGHNSPEYVHLLAEALKHSFADRAEFLGDADYTTVPVKRLISREYAAELAKRIDSEKTKPLEAYGRYQPVADGGTSHFSIIDAQGNAVACTETINTLFGSYVVEPTYGIVLNNEMDDFAAVPGRPNAFGLIQSEANAVGPGRKPLSSMSPTIVVEEGRAAYATGASGGPRIISAVLQVLINLTRFQMSPADAVAAPRLHHQWLPDVLEVEDPLFAKVAGALKQRGHAVVRPDDDALCQTVSRNRDGLRGASDVRGTGRPDGH
ncbi:MAG: gamma-glutamyltransferase [Planctomycetaceae bacterium]